MADGTGYVPTLPSVAAPLHALGAGLDDLAALPRWVAWQTEERDGGKPTKIPYAPGRDGRKAEADNAATWGLRQAAQATADRLPKPCGQGGVGFQLGDLGDGQALGGIDLDTCRAPDGTLAPWAAAIVAEFATYAEASPSGTGVKLFFKYDAAELPELLRTMGTKTGKQWKRPGTDHPPGIELYLTGRYFAVTDDRRPDAPAELRRVPVALLLRLIRETGPTFAAEGRKQSANGQTKGADQSRSAVALKIAGEMRRAGATLDQWMERARTDPQLADWCADKGEVNGQRQLRRTWDKAGEAPRQGDNPEWQTALLRDDRRQAMPNLANAAHALRHAPELAGMLAYDEMAMLPMLRRPVPGSRQGDTADARPLRDADVSAATEWLQSNGLPKLGRETVQQAADLVARENGFHPVRDYLDGLRWDGTPRLATWLSYYLGAKPPADDASAKPSAYLAQIGTMFLVGMVARIYRPGCRLDYMPVFDGRQGVLKSTTCAVLGGKWFSDSLPDLSSGDMVRLSQHLRGKWLIEIPEMSSFSRAESAALKAFITRTEERFTPKYGRQEVIEPRACCFIGTTNETAYLRDATGNRRFWPVTVESCDTDTLAADRDKLFAEAVHLFRRGARWWPDADFEREHIAPEQEGRFIADEWESMIAAAVAGRERVTVGEAAEALHIGRDKLGTADQRRITAALGRLGWASKRDMNGRWWEPKPGSMTA